MSEEEYKVVIYIQPDVIGSGKIVEEALPNEFNLKINLLIDKISAKFKDYEMEFLDGTGDGAIYRGKNLFKAIKGCLEFCKEYRKNPITIDTTDEFKVWRFGLKIFVATGEINEVNYFNKLRAKLTMMDDAANYPENSVVLDDNTFVRVKEDLKRNGIVWNKVNVYTKSKEPDPLYNVEYRKWGLLPFNTKSEIERAIKKINEENEQLKRKIRAQLKYKISFIAIIAIISLISILAIYEYQNEIERNKILKNQIYDQQYNSVRTSIINKIQSFIDVSHVLENTINLGYTENEDKTVFINERIEELKNSDLFRINKKPIQDSIYFYILSQHPECKFLAYSLIKDMNRTSGGGLESCDIVALDLYVTNNYPSTGAGTFVNTVAQKIRLGKDASYDLTTGVAIDWDEVSEDIRRSNIKISDVKFALVDREQFLIMECAIDNCKSMKTYAAENFARITPDSRYSKYDPKNYANYTLFREDTFQDNEFHKYDVLRTRILDGWKLYMYVDESNNQLHFK